MSGAMTTDAMSSKDPQLMIGDLDKGERVVSPNAIPATSICPVKPDVAAAGSAVPFGDVRPEIALQGGPTMFRIFQFTAGRAPWARVRRHVQHPRRKMDPCATPEREIQTSCSGDRVRAHHVEAPGRIRCV